MTRPRSWADTQIKAGQEWKAEIGRALSEARVAILLISADFLASDFIDKDELPPLLLAQKEEGLEVLPVILGSCLFELTPTLNRFQAINSPGKPLLGLPPVEQDSVWVRLVTRVVEILKDTSEPALPNELSVDVRKAEVSLDSVPTEVSAMRTELVESELLQNFSVDLGNDELLKLVPIANGTFSMGSPGDEYGRFKDEGPQHEVTISRFWMGKYPVTQAQWKIVAGWPKVNRDLKQAPSKFKGEERPVEQISWFEAEEFCNCLSTRTNRHFRLPSEAEWEYACRAGTTTPYSYGHGSTEQVANHSNSLIGELAKAFVPGLQRTTSVRKYKANAFGLHDMYGNVREWCADWWHKNYDGAPPGGTPWIKEGEENTRVSRGGSWGDAPGSCRSAYRFRGRPGDRYYYFGFRVACSSARGSS